MSIGRTRHVTLVVALLDRSIRNPVAPCLLPSVLPLWSSLPRLLLFNRTHTRIQRRLQQYLCPLSTYLNTAFIMQYKVLSLAALAATASAQTMNLTAAIAGNPNLTNLTAFSSFFPSSLAMAQNITVLAPSDQAFAKFLNSSAGSAVKANDTAAIQAILSYHILNGSYQASMFTSNATFVPTSLSNMAYTNVTGGQRVEAVMVGKNVSIFSGLLQNSTVTQAVSALQCQYYQRT